MTMTEALQSEGKDVEGSKRHHFEASQISGVLVYSLDHGPSMHLRFTQNIQLTVFVDLLNEGSELYESGSVCLERDQTGEESTSVCANPSPTAEDAASKHPAADIESSPVSPLHEANRTVGPGKKSTLLNQKKTRKEGSQLQKKAVARNMRSKVKTSLEPTKRMEKSTIQKTRAQRKRSLEAETATVAAESGQDAEDAMANVTKCQYCEQEFSSLRQFYDHRRAEGSEHRCGICGKVEPFEANLIVHMQRHGRVHIAEGEGKDKAESLEQGDKGKAKRPRKEKMKCNICGLVVSSIDSLKIHTMLHTGESPYRCCVCGDKFSSLSSRQHHMDTHVTVHRFRCMPCNLRFPSRAELAKHQLNHQFQCSLCGEVFPNKTSRTCHFRVAHPNDILRCSQCPALFSCKEALERHTQYHQKGRRQQCPTCGLVVSKLKEHVLLHSSTPQPRMYVCDQCPVSYLRKANLERHMRTHTGEKPYACSHCPKRFRSNGMLRKHLLTHTQERPFQCEVCGKRCALRSNLAVHMRVHSSHRQFSCHICAQTFNHKNSLQGHIRSKHSKPPTPLPVPAPSLPALLGPPNPALYTSTISAAAQGCEQIPPSQVEASLQMATLSPVSSRSDPAASLADKGRPEYSHPMQLTYTSGGTDPLMDQGQMLHPQSELSFTYW